MIIDESCVSLKKIKRANTDWWINEKSIVGTNGMTYIAYCNDIGEVHIKEMSAKCSKTPSTDICLCRMNHAYADEHNSPSLCITKEGFIIVAYTGHASSNVLKYRITAKPYDINSFGPEQTLSYDGSVTYAQLSENEKKNEIWLFTRVNHVTWQFRYSKDMCRTWSNPVTVVASDKGGLYYMNIRKQFIIKDGAATEQWFFAIYGHPRISEDHTIHSGLIDADGTLCKTCGTKTDTNIYGSGKSSLIEIDEADAAYVSPPGKTVRLLTVSPTDPLRIAIATFDIKDLTKAEYYVLRFYKGEWRISSKLADDFSFLAPNATDGAETYVGGIEFYFGVGDAGFSILHDDYCTTDRAFVARKNESAWVLESYVSHDHSATYEFEQTIRKLPPDSELKIWRPTVPIYAQDNMPLYWHEGTYYAHTGGWHCDVCMYIEYDD